MDLKANLWREIMRLEDEIRGPLSRLDLKARKRELGRLRAQYAMPSVYALGQDDYDRGEPCPVHIPERAAGWRNAAGKALLKRPADTGYPRTSDSTWHPGDEI